MVRPAWWRPPPTAMAGGRPQANARPAPVPIADRLAEQANCQLVLLPLCRLPLRGPAKAPYSTISVGRPTLATAAGLIPPMGYLCPDDALVQCAAVRRLEHAGDQGHY